MFSILYYSSTDKEWRELIKDLSRPESDRLVEYYKKQYNFVKVIETNEQK